MFVVTVKFVVKSGGMTAFLPLMKENARRSLQDEPSCRLFDVCLSPDRPQEVFLYEVYDSPAAFEDHKAASHFLAFARASDALLESKEILTFERLEIA